VKGCQGSNQEVLALSFFKSYIFRNDGVDWSGVLFWREGVFVVWDLGL